MIHYRYRSYTQLVKRPVFCRRSYRLSSSRFTENRKYDSGGYLHNVANRTLSVRLWCLSKHLNHMAVNASFRLNSIKILSSEHLGNVFCWHSRFKKPGYQEVYRDIFFCSLLVELLWWSVVWWQFSLTFCYQSRSNLHLRVINNCANYAWMLFAVIV